MVDKMFNVCYLIHGGVSENEVMKYVNVYNFKYMRILCCYFDLVVDVEYSHVLFNMIFSPCYIFTNQ
jgi:uncharacterized membrane protein YozB (DUF420 family)